MTITRARRSRESEMARLVYGWGINDAWYPTSRCPIYGCWRSMLQRCIQFQVTRPNYVGCWVDERWKYFMVFRSWYLEQSPKPGDQLDKDFFGDGKLYSPESCCFVPQWLNKLFNDNSRARGEWPIGVCWEKQRQKFESFISINGKMKRLGRFETPEEAHQAYLKAKREYVIEKMIDYPDPKVRAAILKRITQLG